MNRGTDVKFQKTNAGWNVLGKNTYKWKADIKALPGAKWHKENTTWRLPKNAKLAPLRKILATLKKAKAEKVKEDKKKPVNASMHIDKGVNLKINKVADGWQVTGKSAYEWKEIIKSLGGRWNAVSREWHISSDITPLRKMLSAVKHHQETQAYKKALAEFNPKWRCCDKMKIYSFTSGSCAIHCPEGSILAPHGTCYTGD